MYIHTHTPIIYADQKKKNPNTMLYPKIVTVIDVFACDDSWRENVLKQMSQLKNIYKWPFLL